MRDKPLYPLLLAAYAVLTVLATNVEEVPLSAALRPLGLSLLAALALLFAFRYLFRDWSRASLASGLSVALFFSYGHIYNSLESASLDGFTLGRHRLLFPAWIGLLALGLWWIVRYGRSRQAANRALNGVAAILLAFPLVQLGLFGFRAVHPVPAQGASNEAISGLRLSHGETPPDIYYIILDGYTRDDILQKYYDLDNRPFIDQLETLGFAVARCSQSNYAQTQLSLASSLNLEYLDALDARYAPGSTSRLGLPELIKDSAVRRALEGMGYQVIAFDTGFEATQLADAGRYLSSQVDYGINDFENLLVRTTAGRVLSEGVSFLNLKPDWEARDQAHRERILYTLDELPGLAQEPGPKFVFAHIISPHWPHVFGPNGEAVHEKADSVSGYRNQVTFINGRILPILTQLIQDSSRPPVIIVQGDHGSIIEDPIRRMSILNAYYLPDQGDAQLWEGISPVNTFRLVFNHYFGGSAPYLPDQSYYSTYEDPYNYTLVSNERPGCSEP